MGKPKATLTTCTMLHLPTLLRVIISLGDSDSLIIGEWVVAMGNPLGLFNISNQATATLGIISAINIDFGRKETRGRRVENFDCIIINCVITFKIQTVLLLIA